MKKKYLRTSDLYIKFLRTSVYIRYLHSNIIGAGPAPMCGNSSEYENIEKNYHTLARVFAQLPLLYYNNAEFNFLLNVPPLTSIKTF